MSWSGGVKEEEEYWTSTESIHDGCLTMYNKSSRYISIIYCSNNTSLWPNLYDRNENSSLEVYSTNILNFRIKSFHLVFADTSIKYDIKVFWIIFSITVWRFIFLSYRLLSSNFHEIIIVIPQWLALPLHYLDKYESFLLEPIFVVHVSRSLRNIASWENFSVLKKGFSCLSLIS